MASFHHYGQTSLLILCTAHGEFRLAVGVDEMLLPGLGGPSNEYWQRKDLIDQAKKQKSRLLGSGQTVQAQADAVRLYFYYRNVY